VLKCEWSIRNTPLTGVAEAKTGDVPCFGLYDPCGGGDTRLNFGLRRLCVGGDFIRRTASCPRVAAPVVRS